MNHWYPILTIIGALIGLIGGIPVGYHIGLIAKKVFLDVPPSPFTPNELIKIYRQTSDSERLIVTIREELAKLRACSTN